MEELVSRIRDFMENEMRSCSMDIAGITPAYVNRMLGGGKCSIEEIEHGLKELSNHGYTD